MRRMLRLRRRKVVGGEVGVREFLGPGVKSNCGVIV
jgi:hypothetical protein